MANYDITLDDLKIVNDLKKWPVGFKAVADISTVHITLEDNYRLEREGSERKIGSTDYGHIVGTWIAYEPEDREKLKALGYSEAYISLLHCLTDMHIHYVCFDCDGFKVKEWPQFDW
jgi:hypothetical protein